jgi:peptidoglycan-N-acetylglucosamine deacetylase
MDVLMTVDVECFDFSINSYDCEKIPERIYKEGLPPLLDLFEKYKVRATFFFTGKFAEKSPESVRLVQLKGHEIGCHGYDHGGNFGLDIMDFESQLNLLKLSKKILDSIAGSVFSFRSPALRVNLDSIKAMEEAGFLNDSSIASQRFDGPLTLGSKNKLKWLSAKRSPYFPAHHNIFRVGNSKVLEVPISAMLLPYTGTLMRVFPMLNSLLGYCLYLESKIFHKPIVFLYHPNENLKTPQGIKTTRRGTGLFEYIFADLIRHRIKLRNLGDPALILLEKLILEQKRRGANFMTLSEYRRKHDERSYSD